LFVPGRPVPQGSKTAFVSKSTGKPIVVDKDVRLPQWRMKITAHAIEAQAEWMHTRPDVALPLRGPIGMTVAFYMNRPLGHFGTGRNAGTLKPSAPTHPASMPDLDKLLRAVLDGLTDAQVWKDDGQVVWIQTTKTYADDTTHEGVHIQFGEIH
jgi:Holliday junction resolvase RusA-like endonuclease